MRATTSSGATCAECPRSAAGSSSRGLPVGGLLTDVHNAAELRHAGFVEGLDRHKIRYAGVERAQLFLKDRGAAQFICPQLMGERQPVGADSEADVVADHARDPPPPDGRVALVRVTRRGKAPRGRWDLAVGPPEDPDVADCEIGGADMAVDVTDEARADRLRQLKIGVGAIAPRRLGPRNLLPVLTVARRLENELGVYVGRVGEAARLVVREIDL